ncbi:uncharacterized protein LOC111041806 [Myzus persicae]|uniref:uncharacterized protein LOC111041806 n=1 Tax=Myzus persicae TaxID=13164 RepID=UPI000B93602C|nr:uncharacterized protein LOC111041806 [Myzus persicae]
MGHIPPHHGTFDASTVYDSDTPPVCHEYGYWFNKVVANIELEAGSTKRNAEMVIFKAEYIPEYKWIMLESNSNSAVTTNKEISALKCKSQNNILNKYHQNNIETDFPSIFYLINLVEKMIKYNNKYYERVEKRKQQQIIELQGLTMFLEDICNDLKDL